MIIRWLYTSIALVSYQHLGHDYQVVIQHTRVLHLFLIPIWTLIIMWLYPSIVLVSNPQMGLARQVLIRKYCTCFLSPFGPLLSGGYTACASIALVSYLHLGHDCQVVIREYCTCFLSTFGPWLSSGYMQVLCLFLIHIWAMVIRWLYVRNALVSKQHLGLDCQVVICQYCPCFLSQFGPWLSGGYTRVLHLFLIPIWAMIIRWLYTCIALVSFQYMSLDYQLVIHEYCPCFLSTFWPWLSGGYTPVLRLFLINIWAMIIRWLYVRIALVSY